MTGFLRRWWQRLRADVRLLRQARRDAYETAWGGPDHLDAAAWQRMAFDARFDDILHAAQCEIDGVLAERDPEFADWLRQGGAS